MNSPVPSARADPASRAIIAALTFYYLTTVVALLGIVLGCMVRSHGMAAGPSPGDVIYSCTRGDGAYYEKIATDGYEYGPGHLSRVAFFPAYPLAIRALSGLTGVTAQLTMLIVSHVALAGAFAMTALYLRRRYPDLSPVSADHALLALGLYPLGVYFRLGYSESLFLLVVALCLYGLLCRWPPLLLAGLVGLATACRPVGVALLPPLIYHMWRAAPHLRAFALRGLPVCLMACWGLAAYMGYQYLAFGEPFAFATTQANYTLRPPVSLPHRAVAWLSLEPLWSVFQPSSPAYWMAAPHYRNPLFNDRLINLTALLGTLVVLGVGAWRRWLNTSEMLLSGGLLVIPYLTRAYETCLESSGRFTAVVFPMYLILGRLLAAMPPPLAACCLSLCAALLALYSAMFAAGWLTP